MNIEIRPAKPEDAERSVPLIFSSGPAVFDYVFSHNTAIHAKEYLSGVFQTEGGEFGYGTHFVATLDKTVIAAGAAFSGEAALAYLFAAARGIFSHYGVLKSPGVIRRGLQVESIIKPPKGDLHYIAHIGTDPDYRSRGVGGKLVEFLLEEGRRLGRTTAALDVSVENPRAEALYDRLGFTVTQELKSKFENTTARVPDHRRMEIQL